MIKLYNVEPIGIGTNKACYIHENDNSKCIKVNISNDFSEIIREIKYYKFLQNRNISFRNLAKFYGTVSTDMGTGYIFDLIKDYDGKVSKMLLVYLDNNETEIIKESIRLLKELKCYSLTENLIIKDLNVRNIMYQKIDEKKGKLIIIDGISISNRVRYLSKFNFFSKNIINKYWEKFEKKLIEEYNMYLQK